MGTLGRIAMLLLSLPLLVAGSYGLLASYLPNASITDGVQRLLFGIVEVARAAGLAQGHSPALTLEGWLVSPMLRFSLAPAGVVLLMAA